MSRILQGIHKDFDCNLIVNDFYHIMLYTVCSWMLHLCIWSIIPRVGEITIFLIYVENYALCHDQFWLIIYLSLSHGYDPKFTNCKISIMLGYVSCRHMNLICIMLFSHSLIRCKYVINFDITFLDTYKTSHAGWQSWLNRLGISTDSAKHLMLQPIKIHCSLIKFRILCWKPPRRNSAPAARQ